MQRVLKFGPVANVSSTRSAWKAMPLDREKPTENWWQRTNTCCPRCVEVRRRDLRSWEKKLMSWIWRGSKEVCLESKRSDSRNWLMVVLRRLTTWRWMIKGTMKIPVFEIDTTNGLWTVIKSWFENNKTILSDLQITNTWTSSLTGDRQKHIMKKSIFVWKMEFMDL
ncbi:hypothetical protein EYC84_007754 [Monilinia fructicola]|uniref:Uncharacterized protein n=1 Tax=Monilinia fructicola TaxID=38448 RepID=A0A5M9JJD0_MONFR|nr:hypothetical protein EYC84_007754 [Monilinia fructicola]